MSRVLGLSCRDEGSGRGVGRERSCKEVMVEIWRKRYVPGCMEFGASFRVVMGGEIWRTRKLVTGSEVKMVPSTVEGSGPEVVTRILYFVSCDAIHLVTENLPCTNHSPKDGISWDHSR